MDTLLPFALLCLTSFFTLTNPLGTMPVFLTMTQGMTEKERRFIVTRATLTAFIIIMVFTFAGQFLFKFFGISTNGFRIAGGFIIFKIGYDMLQARYTPMKLKDEEIKTYANDISITPLGIPMLCGPGAIANAIVLMQDAHTMELKGVLIGSIAFIYLLTYFILRASTRLVDVLGETGNNVMMRLMGLILMVIAVECFVGGMKPILVDVLTESYKMLPEVILTLPLKYIFPGHQSISVLADAVYIQQHCGFPYPAPGSYPLPAHTSHEDNGYTDCPISSCNHRYVANMHFRKKKIRM